MWSTIALVQYAYQNGYEIRPPMETYISDPNETPEDDLLTEVLPVMKNRSKITFF